MQEMRPTCHLHLPPDGLTSFFLSFSTPAALCCLFHTLGDFTNCSAMSPRGKTAENRMWIHLRLTNTLGETPCCCRANCPDLPTWFTSCFPFCRKQNSLKQKGICVYVSQTMFQPHCNYFTRWDCGTVVLICKMLQWSKATLSWI